MIFSVNSWEWTAKKIFEIKGLLFKKIDISLLDRTDVLKIKNILGDYYFFEIISQEKNIANIVKCEIGKNGYPRFYYIGIKTISSLFENGKNAYYDKNIIIGQIINIEVIRNFNLR